MLENVTQTSIFFANWPFNAHTSMSEKERRDRPVYGILHDHHLVLVPGPLFPLRQRQAVVMKLNFLSPKLRSQTTTTNVLPSASSSGSPWRHPRTPWCRPSSFWCSLPWTHTGSRWKRWHQKPADHELVVSWTAQTPERHCADSLPPPDWTQLALFIICNLVTYNIYNI